ncbi:MAG: hypothetical protein ACREUM_02790, partial [Nitrosospira sp.]
MRGLIYDCRGWLPDSYESLSYVVWRGLSGIAEVGRSPDLGILKSTTPEFFPDNAMLSGITEVNNQTDHCPVQKQSDRVPAQADE